MIKPLAILLLFVSPLFAGWPDSRIVRLDDGGSGSFVRIGDCTMILSCAHRTATVSVAAGDKVRYQCGDDSQGMATVIAVYPHDSDSRPFRDCAIYAMDRQPPAGVEPFTLTKSDTQPGTKVWVVGFPMPSMTFRSRVTRVLGYDGTLWLDGGATPGESGGPIVNENGEIVGTLTGSTNDGRTLCCPAVVLGELARDVRTTWCPNGRCQQCPQQQWQQVQQPITQQLPPHPPQPINPPLVDPPKQPTIDYQAEIDKQQQQIVLLQNQIADLRKMVAGYKECQCGAHSIEVDQKITAAIAAIHFPTPEKPSPPNYDVIAAEVGKRLPPFYMRVNPQAAFQPVQLGQAVTLPLIKEQPK